MAYIKAQQPNSRYQSNENKKWDDINAKKADAIAWQGAHNDASHIVAALIAINVGLIKLDDDSIKETHQKWVNHFYDCRFTH